MTERKFKKGQWVTKEMNYRSPSLHDIFGSLYKWFGVE